VARPSREQVQLHNEACALVALDRDLTEEEKEFVLDHYLEAANVGRSLDGAFFTPGELAWDFRFHVYGDRVIDLCAGIGRLSFACREVWTRQWEDKPPREFVCVERNPEFVRVGRRILPEATWICGDVLDVPSMGLGTFDCAISNPPFGRVSRSGDAPGFTGPRFEFHVIAVAATLARCGAFLIPQMSAPFRYSGRLGFQEHSSSAYERFNRETGIELMPNIGIDTEMYRDGWRDNVPITEIVRYDLDEMEMQASRIAPKQMRKKRATAATAKPKADQSELFEITAA
jgi:hypothetical protein